MSSAPAPHRAGPQSTDRPRYVEWAAGEQLAPWVDRYWCSGAAHSAPHHTRVLPDGCVDLVFDLAHADAPLVVGAMRRPLLVRHSGPVDIVGVRFRPGGALPFLDVTLRELTDARVPLATFWGSEADAIVAALRSGTGRDRVRHLERVLLLRRRARIAAGREGELVGAAVNLLGAEHRPAAVREVVAALGIGQRGLERAFERWVGLSPRVLARVFRFQRLVRRIGDAAEAPRWAAVAAEAGYADQPHLIRDFRALAGITPARFAVERRVGNVQDAAAAASSFRPSPASECSDERIEPTAARRRA
ncbi:MAG TPA: DUF6597 domain-containing transcriptional factor [Gemmatimonadales bacterium]|nr:DUF6597 domain-containing transcriptional factor [Gemmatimonadales bacterium]